MIATNKAEKQEQVFREIFKEYLPENLKNNIAHLDTMLDFYFKVILNSFNVTFTNQFQAEMSHTVQMMFTKAKSFRVLLDGVSHTAGSESLINLVDHTVLFTIARSAYEQLLSFELVYVIPDTEEKRIVMKNAYIAASAVNRLSIAKSNPSMKNAELGKTDKAIIQECKQIIENTSLYQSLPVEKTNGSITKSEFEEIVFRKGKYQFVFDNNDNTVKSAGWDNIRNQCNLSSDILNGLYKYLCNMAHPSYMALVQFMNAYTDDNNYHMCDYSIMVMNIILSVFIMDYMEVFPKTKSVFESQDEDTQFKIRTYCDYLRGKYQKNLQSK